jgi:proline dehydrogenase
MDCSVAIKPPSIRYDAGIIQELLSRGQGASRLHFDSLDWTSAEDSFRLLRRCPDVAERLGCTLPGRWYRSIDDVSRVRDLGFPVRLVKGQWPDCAGKEREPSAGLLSLARRLAGHPRTVAIASHDVPVARMALLTLLASGTPCELQLLHGLPARGSLQLARELNVPVRFYLPYGHAWLPYALRQAARRPKILFWLLRDTLAARSSAGALDSAGGTLQ